MDRRSGASVKTHYLNINLGALLHLLGHFGVHITYTFITLVCPVRCFVHIIICINLYNICFFPRFLANQRRRVLSRSPPVPKFRSKNKICPTGMQNISRLPPPPTRLKLTVIEKHESGKLLSSPHSLAA